MAQVLKGTVTDFPGFDERADAETLRKAMKGLGTDEDSILTLLTSRSNAQRQEIAAAFKTLFGRDLLDDLKSELTGKFEKLIVALMKPSWLYDAYELKHALKGAGTNEKVLTEIIASRTPKELTAIKQVYEEEYGSSLEDDVVGDTSGYYQRLLVVLLQANRDPDGAIDEAQVEQDAQALFQAGELKWGTDEEKFITIFGTRSVSHLRRVFDKYMTISGFQIEETIDRETSGHLEQLLLAVGIFTGQFLSLSRWRSEWPLDREGVLSWLAAVELVLLPKWGRLVPLHVCHGRAAKSSMEGTPRSR
ncbi:annexin A5 isoform X2 [Pteropus medius]|uniref:annexin A5 isoform X2 n=1 Tax=Pteropus vampyrus TaxID=132908 RepID=UPI00196AAEB0|nr:annexin A5 isoform X2 [Pteropus giganteus]